MGDCEVKGCSAPVAKKVKLAGATIPGEGKYMVKITGEIHEVGLCEKHVEDVNRGKMIGVSAGVKTIET